MSNKTVLANLTLIELVHESLILIFVVLKIVQEVLVVIHPHVVVPRHPILHSKNNSIVLDCMSAVCEHSVLEK